MAYITNELLEQARPDSIQSVNLPVRSFFRMEENKEIPYYPSPVNWCGEVLYFLMVDRFNDDCQSHLPKFDRSKPFSSARPADFRIDKWAQGLCICQSRISLVNVAKGLERPSDYFEKFSTSLLLGHSER